MENDNLQKIDEILRRTNTDYSTAKQALMEANGDVLEAVIIIENMNKKKWNTSGCNRGEKVMNQIKDVISKGNATKLTVKKNNEVIVNVPITAGLIGTVIAPFLSAAGITAALLTQCTVEITQSDGKIIDIGQKVDKGMDAVKDVVQDVKEGADDLKDDITNSFNKNNDEF